MTPTQPQHFAGTATIHLADGTPLPGERRYSILLVPWCNRRARWRSRRGWSFAAASRCLEGEPLTMHFADGRSFTSRITDVSEVPPHRHTFIARQWPSAAPEAV